MTAAASMITMELAASFHFLRYAAHGHQAETSECALLLSSTRWQFKHSLMVSSNIIEHPDDLSIALVNAAVLWANPYKTVDDWNELTERGILRNAEDQRSEIPPLSAHNRSLAGSFHGSVLALQGSSNHSAMLKAHLDDLPCTLPSGYQSSLQPLREYSKSLDLVLGSTWIPNSEFACGALHRLLELPLPLQSIVSLKCDLCSNPNSR